MRAAEERVRLILSGGTLADGARRGRDMTEEDALLEEALFYDSVAQLYGWTPDVVDSVPDELLGNMLRVARIRRELEEDSARRVAHDVNGAAGGAQR